MYILQGNAAKNTNYLPQQKKSHILRLEVLISFPHIFIKI